MEFTSNEFVEIEASPFRALGRVRAIDGDRLHIALEPGGYLPWLNTPVLVRRPDDWEGAGEDARIVQAGGTTALLELIAVSSTLGGARFLELQEEPSATRKPAA